MKGQRNNSSNRYLLDVSQDGSSSSLCDHRPALREMAREQSLVTQLRAIVLPAIHADGERRDLVAHIFDTILDCSRKAMSELQVQIQPDDHHPWVDDKRRVIRKKIHVHCSKEEEVGNKPHRQHKRRRLDDSVSLETPVPHYDGHQWRKYGQKNINKAKHPRSYYRCTYRQEQGCKATKTVQKQQDGSNGDHDHEMYTVVYYGQHTCKGDVVVAGGETASTKSRSMSMSSISGTCTSLAADNDRQTSSLEISELLDDMPADHHLAVEVNQYDVDDQLFDMAAYACFDFGTWEVDEHEHGSKFRDW